MPRNWEVSQSFPWLRGFEPVVVLPAVASELRTRGRCGKPTGCVCVHFLAVSRAMNKASR